MEVRQEGFHGIKGLRLQRLASERQESLIAVEGKACQEAPAGTSVLVRTKHGA